MEQAFWLDRWETGNTPFHKQEPNEALVAHSDTLGLDRGARVFLPLCGKTVDFDWLLAGGFRVAGAELSPLAAEQLFQRLGLTPAIETIGPLTRYRAEDIDMFVGDIFDLTAEALGPVDAVYDRAALIALPPDVRGRYAQHLTQITGGARQLLLCVEYDQTKMDGPPFAVMEAEVREHYGTAFEVTGLARTEIEDGIKGVTPGAEAVWLLR